MTEREFTRWLMFFGCVIFAGAGAVVQQRGDDSIGFFVTSIIFGVMYFVIPDDDNDRTV